MVVCGHRYVFMHVTAPDVSNIWSLAFLLSAVLPAPNTFPAHSWEACHMNCRYGALSAWVYSLNNASRWLTIKATEFADPLTTEEGSLICWTMGPIQKAPWLVHLASPCGYCNGIAQFGLSCGQSCSQGRCSQHFHCVDLGKESCPNPFSVSNPRRLNSCHSSFTLAFLCHLSVCCYAGDAETRCLSFIATVAMPQICSVGGVGEAPFISCMGQN